MYFPYNVPSYEIVDSFSKVLGVCIQSKTSFYKYSSLLQVTKI